VNSEITPTYRAEAERLFLRLLAAGWVRSVSLANNGGVSIAATEHGQHHLRAIRSALADIGDDHAPLTASELHVLRDLAALQPVGESPG
jgi:hypothetical protein